MRGEEQETVERAVAEEASEPQPAPSLDPNDGAADPDPDEVVLPFDPEMLEGATPEVKTSLRMFFSKMRIYGPRPRPIESAIEKNLNSDHVTSLIEERRLKTELDGKATTLARWTNLLILIVVLVFAGFALWLLGDSNPELVSDLLTHVIALAGGLGAGYGYKAWRDQSGE